MSSAIAASLCKSEPGVLPLIPGLSEKKSVSLPPLTEKSSFMLKGTGRPNSLNIAASGYIEPVSNPVKPPANEPLEAVANTFLSSLNPVSNLSDCPSSNKFFVCSVSVISFTVLEKV